MGDTLKLDVSGQTLKLKVEGLVNTPDHVYFVKDSTEIFPTHQNYGFIYMSADTFQDAMHVDVTYNKAYVDVDKKNNVSSVKKLDNRNQVKIKKISMIFHGFYCTLKIPEEKALFFRVVLVYNLVVIYCTGITHQFCTCYKLFVLIY